MEPRWGDFQGHEQDRHLAFAEDVHIQRSPRRGREQVITALCLLPSDLFPEQSDQLWRECQSPKCIVRLRRLLLAVPNGAVDGQAFAVNVTLLESCKLTTSQPTFSRKPIKGAILPF